MIQFDSRNPFYKNPTGAVAVGTPVTFTVLTDRMQGAKSVRMVTRSALTGVEQNYALVWQGLRGCVETWQGTIQPDAPDVFFYHFAVECKDGPVLLQKGAASASVAGNGSDYQLTVYDAAGALPVQYDVMYQIFPDRFCNSGAPKENVPDDRILRNDWGGQPYYKPDASGTVRNDDYFGGDLPGITQKLDYLAGLGVTTLYLNPVFEAHSNHRYNTADYSKIDPLLGTAEDLEKLCAQAQKRGMRILLDGVFSHTGSDSIYFNREGRYQCLGAYQGEQSPYYSWYHFTQFPDKYDAWWGFPTLPVADKDNESYRAYLFGKNGILKSWLRRGIAGFRLDVADELPDGFLDALYACVKDEKPDAPVLGEVWEDATCKIAYGKFRRYLLGGQLDGVMNYPFARAILAFVRDGKDLREPVEQIVEHYPPHALFHSMTLLGSHDTPRALTALTGDHPQSEDRDYNAVHALTPQQRALGLARLRLASFLQFTLPGTPCIYYGDEAGMEGYRDPFNRGCFLWGGEDQELTEWYRALAALRREHPALVKGDTRVWQADDQIFCFLRSCGDEEIFCAVNRTDTPVTVHLPACTGAAAVFGHLENGMLAPTACAAWLLR